MLPTEADYKAAAYHEVAHAVLAHKLGLPIGEKGIEVEKAYAGGVARFWGATSDDMVPAESVDEVVVALLAGGIAHRRWVGGSIGDACIGDDDRIKELLKERYPDKTAHEAKLEELTVRATKMVGDEWLTIGRVAEELLCQKWEPSTGNKHSELLQCRRLNASKILSLLSQFRSPA